MSNKQCLSIPVQFTIEQAKIKTLSQAEMEILAEQDVKLRDLVLIGWILGYELKFDLDKKDASHD